MSKSNLEGGYILYLPSLTKKDFNMKYFVIGLILGVTIGFLGSAIAQSRSTEFIWNQVFDSTLDTVSVIGQ